MLEFKVRFRCLKDVQDFVALAGAQPFRLQVGSERFQVNATSFMGIFALNCRKPLRVCASCSEEEFAAFLEKADRFLDK